MPEGPMIVVAELPCVGCGYNLRMAPADGRCSECGAEVQQSLKETALRWGPKYLLRTSRSVFWAALLAAAMPVTYMVLGLVSAVLVRFAMAGNPEAYYRMMRWGRLGAVAVLAVLTLCFAVAVWLATWPPQNQRAGWRDWLIRAGMMSFVCGILLVAGMLLLTIMELEWAIGRFLYWDIQRYVVMAYPVLFAGLSLTAWHSAARVTQIDRVSGNEARTGFAKWSLRTFACGFAFLMAVLFTMMVLEFVRADLSGNTEEIAAAFAVVAVAASVVGVILSVIALILFSRRLKRTALLAQAAGGVFIGPMAAGVAGEAS